MPPKPTRTATEKSLTNLACQVTEEKGYDLVVYGQTSAGVIAAVQAKRMGKTVIVVGPDKHLGGLSSGGLGIRLHPHGARVHGTRPERSDRCSSGDRRERCRAGRMRQLTGDFLRVSVPHGLCVHSDGASVHDSQRKRWLGRYGGCSWRHRSAGGFLRALATELDRSKTDSEV
jgi:hypothetical protein